MKKTFLIASLLSILLIGCKDGKNEADKTNEGTEMSLHKESHENISLKNDWVAEMKLNNEDKWKANKETTEGISDMMELVEESKPQTVEEYRALAGKLNEEKNIVVKNCTMEGASHDNLHILLYSLTEKIDALKKAESIEGGAKLQHSIHENLKWYFNYFE